MNSILKAVAKEQLQFDKVPYKVSISDYANMPDIIDT